MTISLRDFLFVLFKYQRMIVWLMVLTISLVIFISYLLPESYQASSKLLIKFGRQNSQASATIETPLRQQLSTNLIRKEDIASEAEIITSVALIQRVIREVGINRIAPPLQRPPGILGSIKYAFKYAWREIMSGVRNILVSLGLIDELTDEQRLILALQRALQATPIRNTNVIEVSFRWPIKEISAEFVNRLVDRYIELHVDVHKEKGFYAFVKTQVDETRQQLLDAERSISAYKTKNGVVSLSEQRPLLLKQRADAEAEIQTTSGKIAELGSKLTVINNRLAQEQLHLQPEASGRNPVIDSLKLRLATLELEEKDLQRKYNENHRILKEKREVIAEIRNRLNQEIDSAKLAVSGGSPSILMNLRQEATMIEAEYKGAMSKKQELMARLAELSHRINTLEGSETALSQMTRDLKVLEGNFQIFQAKQEDLRMSDLLDQSRIISVSIIEPATVPFQAVRMIRFLPNKILNILAAIIGSVLVGIILSFLRDYFDHTLDTVRKVNNFTDIRVLASISNLSTRDDQPEDQLASINETISDTRVPIVITSPSSKEGVTRGLTKIAKSLAKYRGKRILLINCNFRDAAESFQLKKTSSEGLTDVSVQQLSKVIQETGFENLSQISRGRGKINPQQFLGKPEFIAALKAFADEFDYVFIATPPILAHSDALVFSHAGFPILMIVDSQNTRAEVLVEAKNRIMGARGTIVGIVLNSRNHPIPEKIYRWI